MSFSDINVPAGVMDVKRWWDSLSAEQKNKYRKNRDVERVKAALREADQSTNYTSNKSHDQTSSIGNNNGAAEVFDDCLDKNE